MINILNILMYKNILSAKAFTLLTSSISGILLNYSESQYLTIVLICSFVMLSGINSSIVNGVTCDIFPTKKAALSDSLKILQHQGKWHTNH